MSEGEISELLREAAILNDLNKGRHSLLQSILQVAHHKYQADICLSHQHGESHCSIIARVGQVMPTRNLAPESSLLQRFSVESDDGALREFVCGAEVTILRRIVLQLRSSHDFASEFLHEFTEVLADLFRRELVTMLDCESQQNANVHQIAAILYNSSDDTDVLTRLASDSAGFLGCSRVSALKKSAGFWKLIAATSVPIPNRRSNEARQISEVVEAAELENTAEVTLKTGSGNDGVDSLVIPLSKTGGWENAHYSAVFEWLGPDAVAGGRNSALRICRHAALAISIAQRRSLRGWFSSQTGHVFSRTRLLTILVTCVVAAVLFFVKTEFRVAVNGQIVPEKRVRIFAPESGIVTAVLAGDGSSVNAGDSLCQLRSDELDLRSHEIEGKIAAAQSRLIAIEAYRGSRGVSEGTAATVEQAELREQLTSLQNQSELLNKRIEMLNIKAPHSGEVLGHQLRELLQDRPVQRGQFLFEIADRRSGWVIEMRVPDEALTYILEESWKTGQPLRVMYSLETFPDVVFHSEINSIESATTLDRSGKLVTFVHARHVDDGRIIPRPGSGVFVRVDCGRARLGFVLCHRLIEHLNRWWHLGFGN